MHRDDRSGSCRSLSPPFCEQVIINQPVRSTKSTQKLVAGICVLAAARPNVYSTIAAWHRAPAERHVSVVAATFGSAGAVINFIGMVAINIWSLRDPSNV